MKKIAALIMMAALTLNVASIGVLAASITDMPYTVGNGFDEDGGTLSEIVVIDGKVTADYVTSGRKIYIELPANPTEVILEGNVPVEDLYDADDFTFKLDRDQNGKYLDSVKFVNKRLGGANRSNYIEVSLKSATMTEDVKVTFDVFFKARTSVSGQWASGDTVNTRFELWVNNDTADGDDATIETGEGIVFNPTSNETNTITWGNDYEVASLKFEANSDADKFYAKLSTRMNRAVYEEYGDPVDADLYFRTFTGKPSIDSTSRATLTLYNPWNEEYNDRYDYTVDPRECYIYIVDSDGYLEDVTDRFTYIREDDTDAGIDGWQTKVRALGSYVISDVALLLEQDAEEEELPDEPQLPVDPPTPGTPVPLPNTGSDDLLAGAVVLAVVSFAAIAVTKKRKL